MLVYTCWASEMQLPAKKEYNKILALGYQWFQSLFRCKFATLNFSMRFNIIDPYTHVQQTGVKGGAVSHMNHATELFQFMNCYNSPMVWNTQCLFVADTPSTLLWGEWFGPLNTVIWTLLDINSVISLSTSKQQWCDVLVCPSVCLHLLGGICAPRYKKIRAFLHHGAHTVNLRKRWRFLSLYPLYTTFLCYMHRICIDSMHIT